LTNTGLNQRSSKVSENVKKIKVEKLLKTKKILKLKRKTRFHCFHLCVVLYIFD
jgi:hypothetical protein